jgi:hypothetical protein
VTSKPAAGDLGAGAATNGPAALPSAIVTASYAPDFERCRLLCETVDRYVTGMTHHYLLVEGRDVALFRRLEAANRTVVDERDILPRWLRPFDDPLSGFKRRVWLSLRTQPMRGWHVQQLRRIAIAAHVGEDVLVFCDSDVAFLRPFDLALVRRDGRTRLFRRDHVLSDERDAKFDQQRVWAANAGRALGLASPGAGHDYITTLIAWDRETVLSMCRRIEEVHKGRNWVAVVGSARRFSECMIYGRYVDEVIAGRGHFHDSVEFCKVAWEGEPMSDSEFLAFVAAMQPGQVAIGMQSFIGTDVSRIRRLVLGDAS